MCVNRFDDDTKASFIDLYTKVDATTESTISTITIHANSQDKQEC